MAGRCHLKQIAQSGASTGQVPVWNGSSWSPKGAPAASLNYIVDNASYSVATTGYTTKLSLSPSFLSNGIYHLAYSGEISCSVTNNFVGVQATADGVTIGEQVCNITVANSYMAFSGFTILNYGIPDIGAHSYSLQYKTQSASKPALARNMRLVLWQLA